MEKKKSKYVFNYLHLALIDIGVKRNIGLAIGINVDLNKNETETEYYVCLLGGSNSLIDKGFNNYSDAFRYYTAVIAQYKTKKQEINT